MAVPSTKLHLLLIVFVVVLLAPDAALGQKRRKRKPAQPPPTVESTIPEGETRLKLADGTYLPVDEAWESPQGIWYRLGGMTHLANRDRVKSIHRGTATKQEVQSEVAVAVEEAPAPETNEKEQPVWIYLKGGARVEADNANETQAGVWYNRGPMSIFIERSRIDRIEREDPNAAVAKERGWSSGRPKLDALIRQNGSRYGVDPYLIFLVMEQESHFNTHAVSPKGARGLMQLMPGTSARFGVRRPHDPAQNISGGTRYLKQLLTQFKGRVDLALASYNAGEGTVIRFGHRVPPYKETRNYVRRISFRYRKAKSPVPQKDVGGR